MGIGRTLVGILLLLSFDIHAADYYLSAVGSDTSNSGLSSASPWKTIGKINALTLKAGDRVLLRGGDSFSGGFNLSEGEGGTSTNPIQFLSYGTGRATIQSDLNTTGFYSTNSGGISISNLRFAGPGGSATKDGISFFAYKDTNVKYDTIKIDNVEVLGFYNGIVIGAWQDPAWTTVPGYKNVSVTNSDVHDNLKSGIFVYGYHVATKRTLSNQNVYIGKSKAYNHSGLSGKSEPTGSGIVISGTDGGTIENSIAYNNGWLNTNSAGPVGIWAYHANNVKLQFNEAYNNRTAGGDGGGFDLDGGVTNSVMQYNYSHDNDGAGFLICQYSGAPSINSNNVVRYNVSLNDGRRSSYGGIQFWSPTSNQIRDIDIYNNTVYMDPSAKGGTPTPVKVYGGTTTNVKLRNNIFVTSGSLPVMDVKAGQVGMLFQGNDYWNMKATPTFKWAGASLLGLAAFRTKGQEKLNTTAVGYELDPMFTSGLQLAPASPLIDRGLDLAALFATPVGNRDFLGTAIPQNGSFDIGAYEFQMSAGVNLLGDPGFELNSASWMDWGNSLVLSTGAHSGSKALQVGVGGGGRGQNLKVNVTPGTLYSLSAWARVTVQGTPAWLGVKALDSAGQQVGAQVAVAVDSTSYQLYSVDFVVPAGAAQLQVWIWKDASNSYLVVDDFSLLAP